MQSIDKAKTVINYTCYEYASMARCLSRFGYKERMLIERGLFLILKCLCNDILKLKLQGFSNYHKGEIERVISENEIDSSVQILIENIFQLKIFVQRLSCENAYVRGDSLSSLDTDMAGVFKHIELKLNHLKNKIYLIEHNMSSID